MGFPFLSITTSRMNPIEESRQHACGPSFWKGRLDDDANHVPRRPVFPHRYPLRSGLGRACSLIVHYAEVVGIERSRPAPDEAKLRQVLTLQSYLRRACNDLNPRSAAEIESAITHYAPLAHQPYADPQNPRDPAPSGSPQPKESGASFMSWAFRLQEDLQTPEGGDDTCSAFKY